jgi:uncharacterized membrane protein
VTAQVIVAVSIYGIGILMVVLFWFMPRLTRHDLYFAVTVSPAFRDSHEGKSILRRYRTELALASVLALAAAVAGFAWLGVTFVPAGYYLQLGASFVVFYRARRHVLPHAVPPTTIREAELHGRNRIIPGGWVAASGPFVLLAACAAYLWIHRTEIPGRFAIHRGAFGQPDRWTARSFIITYVLSIAGLLTALTLILYGIAHWVRPIHAGGPEGARELKFRRTAAAMLLAVEYFITLRIMWIALIQVHHNLKAGPPGMLIALLPLFFVLVVVVMLARLGQGGSRVPAAHESPSSTSAAPVGDRTPDCYWKLGIFYFNPDDPAVIVEHRFGLGYTLNFARPITWIILSLVLMGPLVPIVAARLRG